MIQPVCVPAHVKFFFILRIFVRAVSHQRLHRRRDAGSSGVRVMLVLRVVEF